MIRDHKSRALFDKTHGIFGLMIFCHIGRRYQYRSFAQKGQFTYGTSPGPGDHHISFWILSTRMVPPLSILVPLYVFLSGAGLTRSLAGLTITHFLITLPMIIWIVKGFIDELPESMEESAMIDGCNRIQAFREVVVPLVKPGIAAAAFISFIFSWNNFLLALVLTGGNTKTAPLQIQASMGYLSIDWGMLGAAGTVTVLPVVLISLAIRNYLVEGLTMGAVKE